MRFLVRYFAADRPVLMDINLARTFLEIVSSGSFLAAADRLHLTQTAVGARVRALEDLLGRRLFVRNKAGVTPHHWSVTYSLNDVGSMSQSITRR